MKCALGFAQQVPRADLEQEFAFAAREVVAHLHLYLSEVREKGR